jgi:hypothetical protein
MLCCTRITIIMMMMMRSMPAAMRNDGCSRLADTRLVNGRALKAEEAVDQHDRCIPRRPKSKRDGYQYQAISGGAHGSKRVGG